MTKSRIRRARPHGLPKPASRKSESVARKPARLTAEQKQLVGQIEFRSRLMHAAKLSLIAAIVLGIGVAVATVHDHRLPPRPSLRELIFFAALYLFVLFRFLTDKPKRSRSKRGDRL